uniref:SH3 domain-containing protein n=1 Tax=Denticeps clupeoides TaxID=299321 RepID=A0AAY4BXI3_9TELE
MAPKRKGPLQSLQRETDDVRKMVDALEHDAAQPSGRDEADALQRCAQLLSTVEDQLRTAEKLTKADEPAPVGNYERRKQEEEERLRGLHARLRAVQRGIKPAEAPQPSTSGKARSTSGPGEVGESEEEDSEEEDESQEEEVVEEEEDDEDGEEEEEDDNDNDGGVSDLARPETQKKTLSYIALSTFKGEQDGDLAIEMGDVLQILSKNADGWWLAQDSKGDKGLVPKTYLKAQTEQEVEEEESEEEGDEIDKESKSKSKSPHSNWDAVRKAITEIDATDVLSAMGAIPAGFRPSTLSKLLDEGVTFRGSRYIQPELSQSNLSFKDLFLDPDTGKVRARSSRVCLSVSLWTCRMVPSPGVGLQVLSRHVRLCAFNGSQVLSNIHTVRATYNPKSAKTWSFSPRMSGQLSSLLDGDCFLRCDSDSPDLGILFELGVTYIRNSTGEQGDLSCGWAFLKLFDASGAPVPLRTYELTLHGGTPYETDVEMDPSMTRRAGAGSVFQQMMASRKVPKLVVKLRTPNHRNMSHLNLLPDTLVGSVCSVHLLALYRQLLADTLLLDRVTMQNADLICSSVLATFPEVLDQSDLLDALRSSWENAEKNLKRSEKRDMSILKREFVRVYMDYVFPLFYSAEMPGPRWADEEVANQRALLDS